MGKEIMTFDIIEIEENKFYRNKNLISKIKLLVSNKIPFGEKKLNIYWLLV